MSNNCEFYNQSFLDNLYSYEFKDNNLFYSKDGARDYSIDGKLKKDRLDNFLSTNIEKKSDGNEDDTWLPFFVTPSNSQILYKNLARSSVIEANHLGLEEALSFDPKLRDWTTKNASMVVDWIITPVISPYSPIYGLMYWYKKNKNLDTYNINQIPINTIIYSKETLTYSIVDNNKNTVSITIDPSTKLIKKSNNILLIVDEEKIIFKNDNIFPNTRYKYFQIDIFLSQNKNKKLEDLLFVYNIEANQNNSNYEKNILYISDGDVYSYIDTKNSQYDTGLVSKTYLSPILYDNYRQIYHHLTLDYVKDVEIKQSEQDSIKKLLHIPKPIFNRKQYRLFKKLCYYLATFPLLDRTTASVLQHNDIKNIVTKFINNTTIQSIEDEQKELKEVLIFISKFFNNLQTAEAYHENDKYYIHKKILQKYGARLRFKDTASLSYNHELKYGPHIKVSSNINSLCDKTLENSFIYNNVKIYAGSLGAETLIDEDNSTIILRDENNSTETVSIPLWDISKKTLVNNPVVFTVGPDLELDFNFPESSLSKNDVGDLSKNDGTKELRFSIIGGLSETKDTMLEGSAVSVEWKKISGPDCLRFSNNFLSYTRDNGLISGSSGDVRFTYSNDQQPTIYIKKPGKYVIQCRVSTNFGTYTDNIVIYVIAKDEYIRTNNDLIRPLRYQNITQKNIVIIPNIKEFVFGKQGVFWPTYSDLSLLVPLIIMKQLPGGLSTSQKVGEEVKPFGSPSNKFYIPILRDNNGKKVENNPSFLNFVFDCNNTCIDINEIRLSNIYSIDNINCDPIYRCTIDNQLFDLDLESYTVIDPKTKKSIDIMKPGSIGVEKNNIENLLENNKKEQVSALLFDNSPTENLLFDSYAYDSNIYAKKNSEPGIICYEDIPDQTNPNYYSFNESLIVPMQKGYLHPNSGWITQPDTEEALLKDLKNKTSIITGDHSKRNCKTFRGLGFDKLTNDFIDDNISIYSSSITLNMDLGAFDCAGECDQQALIGTDETFYNNYNDHYTDYGYRDNTGVLKTIYKFSDEIKFDINSAPDISITPEDYCIKNSDTTNTTNVGISYFYPQPGPKLKNTTPGNILYDRNSGRSIGDIEIKLNFLNFINPKELVVWLEVDPCGGVSSRINPGGNTRPADLYYFNSYANRGEAANYINNINSEEIRQYITKLFALNDTAMLPAEVNEDLKNKIIPNDMIESYYSQYILFLLNQDHIDFSVFNNKIKFTNNTYNYSNNNNINKYLTNNNTVARNRNGFIEIRPTTSAPGYSDNQSYIYQKILDKNNLNRYSIANLSKFRSLPLFKPPPPIDEDAAVPDNSSSTKFTLKIAVMGEIDDGYAYDRILNTNNKLNINNIKTKNISNISTNSLCCWNLVISNNNEQFNFEEGDTLGEIDYNHKIPQYDGYNFIGEIPNNIISPANVNGSDHTFFDIQPCAYSKESLTAARSLSTSELVISPINYIPAFTIVGELANIANMQEASNQQAREFFEYFNGMRRARQADQFNREVYTPKYDAYPYGRSNKTLISISQDKSLWFKLEAGIVKYSNFNILKEKLLRYKKIHYLNELRDQAIFSLNRLLDLNSIIAYHSKIMQTNIAITKLLDSNFIIETKNIIIETKKNIQNYIDRKEKVPQSLYDTISEYESILDSMNYEILQENDIIKHISKQVENNKTIEIIKYYTIINNIDTKKLEAIEFSNLYDLLINNKLLFINNNLVSCLKYLKNISVLDLKKEDNTNANEEEHFVFLSSGIRPYFIYNENDTVTMFNKKKKLSDDEQDEIDTLSKQISALREQISQLSPETDKEEITKKKKLILNLDNQIFLIQHEQNSNTIKAKGFVYTNGSFSTLFVFEKDIVDGAFLAIEPNQNRIIIYDKDYTSKNTEDHLNQWTFSINSTKTNFIDPVKQSIFNNGMYGSGGISNNPVILYKSEEVNEIKNIIDIFIANITNNMDYKAKCIVKQKNPDKQETTDSDLEEVMRNIYIKDMIVPNIQYKNHITNTNIANSILGSDKYNAYYKEIGIKYLLEADIGISNIQLEEEGEISIDKNIISETSYLLVDEFMNQVEPQILIDRIEAIKELIINTNQEIKNNNKKLIDKDISEQTKNELSEKNKNLQNKIKDLKIEYNKISYYLDKCSENTNTFTTIPQIYVIYSLKEDGSLILIEKSTDNYYIINIDKDQGCSVDINKLPKVLTEIEYKVLGLDTKIQSAIDLYQILGPLQGTFNGTIAPNAKFKVEINDSVSIKYTLKEEELEKSINKLKDRYNNNKFNWEQNITRLNDRTFYLNGNGSKGNIIRATYKYVIPSVTDIGLETKKVREILNLDDTNNIYLDFRKIARNLRGNDPMFDAYIPNTDGMLTKSLVPYGGGPIDNNLKVWKAIYTETGAQAPLPEYFKWMNLMKYIAFYKNYLLDPFSFDINRGLTTIRSRDEMELIPYDYI